MAGKKRRVKLKIGSCLIVKGHKTFDGEKWDHHDYEVCIQRGGITTRKVGTFPEDDAPDDTGVTQ